MLSKEKEHGIAKRVKGVWICASMFLFTEVDIITVYAYWGYNFNK